MNNQAVLPVKLLSLELFIDTVIFHIIVGIVTCAADANKRRKADS